MCHIEDTGLLGRMLASTPKESDVNFQTENSAVYEDINQYKRMIKKTYLSRKLPNSQSPKSIHA